MLNSLAAIYTGAGVPASTTAYESIATVTASGGESSLTFSSIASTYTHLQIRYLSRNQGASGDDPLNIQFNSDFTNSNYKTHRLHGDGSSASSDAYSYPIGATTNGNGNANTYFAGGVVDILDYANTNKNKTIRSLSGWDGNGSGQVYLISELWINTAAISTIKLSLFSGGTFGANSTFALYGVK